MTNLADELERLANALFDEPDAERRIYRSVALSLWVENALPAILSALRREEWQGIETVVVEARDAVAFLDRVRAASSDEQIAVGQDHWNRAEAALRAVAALPTKGTDHE